MFSFVYHWDSQVRHLITLSGKKQALRSIMEAKLLERFKGSVSKSTTVKMLPAIKNKHEAKILS